MAARREFRGASPTRRPLFVAVETIIFLRSNVPFFTDALRFAILSETKLLRPKKTLLARSALSLDFRYGGRASVDSTSMKPLCVALNMLLWIVVSQPSQIACK